MANRYFSILNADHAIFDGHGILANTGSVYNGNLAMLGGGTSGSMVLSTGSAIGMFFDMLAMKELPSTQELVANIGGKYVNVAMGAFEALIGPDLFYGGALPTPGTVLYDFGNGTIDTAARGRTTRPIGLCMDVSQTIRTPSTGSPIDSTYQVARCKFDFTQIL